MPFIQCINARHITGVRFLKGSYAVMNHFFSELSQFFLVNPLKRLQPLLIIGCFSISFNAISQTNIPLLNESPALVDSVPEPQLTEKVSAEEWLIKLRNSLTTSNFQAGIVTMKAGKTTSYSWLHGVVAIADDNGKESADVKTIEVESISPLMGSGVSNFRQDQVVTFIEPNKEAYSIKSESIRKFIPPIFYKNALDLSSNYNFVMSSKSEIGGRPAQLIRLESINHTTHDYWIWLDVQSSLPLRMAFVNQKNEVIEQVVMTQLSLFSGPSEDIIKLSQHILPAPILSARTTGQETNNWDMSWLPDGFTLIKSDRHHLSITGEVSDYYLYSDGLVEFSIYVQRQLESFNSPLILQEGAMSFVMLRSEGFDVTVVGEIPTNTAHKIARSIKSN